MFSRRAAIKGVASMYGLGRSDPSRFPYSQRPQSTGAAPGPGNIVRARFVLVFGPSGGVFVYNGGPGLGNPPIAALTSASTDPFGNSIRPGDAAAGAPLIVLGTAPSGGTQAYVELVPGNPPFAGLGTGDAAEATPGQLTTGINGSGVTRTLISRIFAPRVTGENAFAFAEVRVSSPSPDLTSFTPQAELLASDGVNGMQVIVTPSLITLSGGAGTAIVLGNQVTATGGSEANPTVISTDTWQTVPSFGAGFAAGGPTPQYALMPFGVGGAASVAIRGQVLATAATAVGAPMFTLPFTFARQHDFVTPNNLAGAALGQRIVRVAASGAVQCQAVGANTNFVILDGIIANRG